MKIYLSIIYLLNIEMAQDVKLPSTWKTTITFSYTVKIMAVDGLATQRDKPVSSYGIDHIHQGPALPRNFYVKTKIFKLSNSTADSQSETMLENLC